MTVMTGPQYYPPASRAYWYEDNYPGDQMEVNACVLHTTEGRSVPGYNGGADAPNFTAAPDFANQRLVWYQHFRVDVSSRALVNLAGGVETNTNNVVQVELVGTCAPSTHADWGSASHIYWADPPDWALDDLADFLRWLNANHGVPLSGPSQWTAYPASYGSSAPQRMTGAQWNAFRGICGHEHVPENLHGDPGALPFARLLAKAKGEDMALTADDKAWITGQLKALLFAETLGKDAVQAPDPASANPTWQAASYLRNIFLDVQTLKSSANAVLAQARANGATLTELKTLLAALDLSGLTEEVAAKLASFRLKLEETA